MVLCSSPWISFRKVSFIFKIQRLTMSSSPPSNYKLLFPGQGSQYVGMTSSLSEVPLSSSLQDLFDVSKEVFGHDVRQLMLTGPQEALNKTINCQPAVVVASLAAFKSLDPKIVQGCTGMAGFSVGEITALIAAGGISLKQGLLLVRERAKAMQQACRSHPSGMLTVMGLDQDKLQDSCQRVVSRYREPVHIANHLFPFAFTVSGSLTGLHLFKTIAIEEGAMSIKDVPVGGGFHCKLMQPAVAKFRKVLDSVNITMPRIPVYSNVTARPYTSVEEIKELLIRQLVTPVLWKQTMFNMIEGLENEADENEGEIITGKKQEENKEGQRQQDKEDMKFIEVGPGKQLKSMLGKINRKSFSNCSNFDT